MNNFFTISYAYNNLIQIWEFRIPQGGFCK